MSFMRGEWYIYDHTAGFLVIQHGASLVEMPHEVAIDLATMIWHQLSPEQQREAMERVAERYDGNFGADGVLTALGRPTAGESLRALIEEHQGD